MVLFEFDENRIVTGFLKAADGVDIDSFIVDFVGGWLRSMQGSYNGIFKVPDDHDTVTLPSINDDKSSSSTTKNNRPSDGHM